MHEHEYNRETHTQEEINTVGAQAAEEVSLLSHSLALTQEALAVAQGQLIVAQGKVSEDELALGHLRQQLLGVPLA